MARSARSLDEPERWSFADAAAALLGMVARNPTLVGGSTAFIVALSFVSANALWYQPHAHSGAFFATRDLVRAPAPDEPQETTILIERPEPPRQVEGDPVVKSVQGTLKELNFYAGDVDGLYGPNTRVAIEAYQNKMGMAVTGAVDDDLLDHLGTGSVASVLRPSPAPRDAAAQTVAAPAVPATAQPAVVKPAAPNGQLLQRIQAGLKEFGNDDIQIDGLMGAKTEAAIREFQSLFSLPQTGRADEEVYAKMKEIGLVQ
jgi:peptidoglycan hydrolase-like protein with peptidoglycan-binding domain